jgi:hypothetical protein
MPRKSIRITFFQGEGEIKPIPVENNSSKNSSGLSRGSKFNWEGAAEFLEN